MGCADVKTPNLELPEVPQAIEGASDEINDGFHRLDAMVQLAVLDRDLTQPPTNPQQGDRYIVPTDAIGAWLTRRRHIAYFTATGWRYLIPRLGWIARVLDEPGVLVEYTGTQWEELTTGGGSPGADPLAVYEHFSDMDFGPVLTTTDMVQYRAATSGNGAVASENAPLVAGRPGIIRITKGGGGNGQAILYWSAECIALGDGETSFECDVMTSFDQATTTTPVAPEAGILIFVGIADMAGGNHPNNGVYFFSSPAHEDGVWRIVAEDGENVTIENASGGTRPTKDQWIRLKIVVNAAGTEAEFFIDGESQGVLDSNIPGGSRDLRWRWHVENAPGYNQSNGGHLYIDWVRVRKVLTTSRA